jgi:acetyl esterase/lipase
MRRLALTGCLLLALPVGLSAQEPKAPPPVRHEAGVVFGKGGGVELKLDLAMPGEGDGPFPAVLCVHGGGWVGGDRQQMAQTLDVLARRGFVAVTPDYRLAPAHRFPAQLEDCKAAVRWLRANAGRYNINPERVGAVGFSAGAHLACLLGVTDKDDGLEGEGGHSEQSSRVQAVVSFFGPTDLAGEEWDRVVLEKNLVPLLGGTPAEKADEYRRASPLTYAGRKSPPFLFFHGSEDKMVPLRQSRRMADKLLNAGSPARVLLVEGEGHGWRGAVLTKTIDEMLIFLDKQLKP